MEFLSIILESPFPLSHEGNGQVHTIQRKPRKGLSTYIVHC